MLDRLLSRAARRGKAVAGWILYRTHLYRLFRRDEAVIVVFHRVNDSYPTDPLTCSSQEFEDFVRFFARFFEVISLGELLTRVVTRADLTSVLAITFDDGYRGNATIAAPILERHGVRASFFVTTQFIGTDVVPWWDAKKNIETHWMTWDQVRSLRAAGHEIGSHTETHVDLGAVSREEARREVAGASARVDAELGERSGLFAYPYGGRENMSDENHAVVKEIGLRCNLSAFGGIVKAGDDPFRLKRVTVSRWFMSPYQFGFDVLAGRLSSD